jgi:uncharacterized protein (TIGR03083 family)
MTNADDSVLAALDDEAAAFAAALGELPASAWDRPTRCHPWTVRDMVGHVITVLARTPTMIAAPAPDRPDTTAVGYYRADERFSSATNADRVSTARKRATAEPAHLIREFTDIGQAVTTLSRQEPVDRVVRTRHGDAMLLPEFLTTRVVELAIHGLDIADAIPRLPWLTSAAADHLQQLLFGPAWRSAVAELGWDPVVLLRRASGRAPITDEESAQLERLGIRRLTLG